MTGLQIGRHRVGSGQPCLLIAEAGVNHNGDLSAALQLVVAASNAGADAVKFQSFFAEDLVSASASKAPYQVLSGPPAETQLEMLHRLELSPESWEQVRKECDRRGILFLSTPFDRRSLDMLDIWDVPAIKIGSGDLTDTPFLAAAAALGRPLILSTGMATMQEIRDAVAAVHQAGNHKLLLLHCVSSYPAAARDVNLRAMATLGDAFGLPIGYSDHTLGIEVAIAARAMGACVIEKHLTLDRLGPGPDHQASIEPQQFASLVAGIRTVEEALGDGVKIPAASEQEVALVARKSLVAARMLVAGTRLKRSDVAVRRPGTGLPPSSLDKVVGAVLVADVAEGEVLTYDNLSPLE